MAIVHSLLSGRPGRANRGRFYLPLTAANIGDSLGEVPTATQTALCSAFKTLVLAVTAVNCGGRPVILAVASPDSVDKDGNTVSRPVVPVGTVLVDSKIDTQRRRADKIAATRLTSLAL